MSKIETDPPFRCAIITAYFNCTNSQWMQDNMTRALQNWNQTGAYVILVELLIEGSQSDTHEMTDFYFKEGCAHQLLQHRVHDVMWYKENALNLAMNVVPDTCDVICWADNDVLIESPSDWLERVRECTLQPNVHFVHPFQTVRMFSAPPEPSEAPVAAGVEGDDANTAEGGTGEEGTGEEDGSKKTDTPRETETETETGSSVLCGGTVTGCMWACKRLFLQKLKLFPYCIVGDGNALQYRLWVNHAVDYRNVRQAYYAEPTNPLQNHLNQYVKRLRRQCGGQRATCVSMPGEIHVLYHGSRSRENDDAAVECFRSRNFNLAQHTRAYANGLIKWSDHFRETGINSCVRLAIDRIVSKENRRRSKLYKNREAILFFVSQLNGISSPDAYTSKAVEHVVHLAEKCIAT
jgi:hypothetical protein